jgi:hypothetical protein
MMKKLKRVTLVVACQAALASNCFAGGTVDFNEYVVPLIKQRPFFYEFLIGIFEFDKSAFATTIGGNINSDLAGYRIGPYTVCAKIRGTSGSCNMDVVIDTNTHFFDASGKELDGPEGARTVKEDFYAIEVNPAPK